MSEEIKEKIDKSKENHRYNITSSREWFENLLDYITNLQQENKHLNLQLDQTLKDYEELLIKISKAIEYIKKHSNCSGYFEDGKMIIDNIESINGGYELLEILGGDDNGM